jgi:hypothetical protein
MCQNNIFQVQKNAKEEEEEKFLTFNTGTPIRIYLFKNHPLEPDSKFLLEITLLYFKHGSNDLQNIFPSAFGWHLVSIPQLKEG